MDELENIMLGEKGPDAKDHIVDDIRGRLGLGEMGGLGATAKRSRVSFLGDETVLNLIVVMVVQLGEYTKKH